MFMLVVHQVSLRLRKVKNEIPHTPSRHKHEQLYFHHGVQNLCKSRYKQLHHCPQNTQSNALHFERNSLPSSGRTTKFREGWGKASAQPDWL